MKYEDSGVDIERGRQAKKAIAKHVSSTWGPEVLSETGAFGGLFRLGPGYEDPVLVSSVDGVGTKLIAARMAGRYDTVGQDLVNHCVDDILVQGARPLFFLDYIASGSLDPEVVASVVDGVATACRNHGCALIGGETAEMPDVYQGEDFDIAGCIVGVVDRKNIIDGSGIRPGDRVLGLPSNGLHTNGYSLVRKIVFEKLGLAVGDFVDELGATVGDELLKIHRSYLAVYDAIAEAAGVKGLAHITGGGIVDNLSRILPGDCSAVIRKGAWPVPSVFSFLQNRGEVASEEMFQVFNMGLGMLVVVSAEDEAKVIGALESEGDIYAVGVIEKGDGNVTLV